MAASQQLPATLLAQMAQQYAGPQAIPAIQKSQYLADALRSMQETGGQNIRTPGALGSNLLAEALLQWARNRNDHQLLGQVQAGQTNAAADAQRGIYGPDQIAAPVQVGGGAPATAPTAQTPPPLASALAPQIAPPPPQNAALASALRPRGMRDNNPVNVTNLGGGQMWQGQVGSDGSYAKFDTPENGWRAADMNLANYGKRDGIGTLAGAINRWAPAAGGNNPGAYAGTVGKQVGIDPSAPINLADPNLRHQLLSGMAGVELGQPAQFGQGFGQSPAPQPSPGGAPPAAGMGAPPVGASLPPMGGEAPQMQPQAPQAPQGPPTGPYATPQERAYIQERLSHPQGSLPWMQGLQAAQEIQQRTMHPLDAPKDMMWGPDGRAVPVPGTQYQTVASGPGGATQADPFGKLASVNNPNAGPIPAGMMASNGPNGPSLQAMAGAEPRPLTDPAERAKVGILPSDHNAYAVGPDGKVSKVADNPYGPKEIQSVHDNFWGSDESKKYQEAYSAYTGLTTALGNANKNGGPLDQAALDSFLRGINPGMGARNSTVQMVMNHFGLPEELKGHLSSLFGNGFITPQILQQLVQVTHDYAQSHYGAAMTRAQADARMVAPYGYGSQDLAEDLPQLGSVPTVRFGGSGVQPPNASQPPASGPAGLLPGLMPGQAHAAQAPAASYDAQASLANARAAIARGAPRAAVEAKLRAHNIDPSGL